MNSVFCYFSREKSTKYSQNPGLVNEFSAPPRGQLNWTGPIANGSDKQFSNRFFSFFFSHHFGQEALKPLFQEEAGRVAKDEIDALAQVEAEASLTIAEVVIDDGNDGGKIEGYLTDVKDAVKSIDLLI